MKSNLTVPYIVACPTPRCRTLSTQLTHNTWYNSLEFRSALLPPQCPLPGGTLSPKLHGFMFLRPSPAITRFHCNGVNCGLDTTQTKWSERLYTATSYTRHTFHIYSNSTEIHNTSCNDGLIGGKRNMTARKWFYHKPWVSRGSSLIGREWVEESMPIRKWRSSRSRRNESGS